LRLPSKPGAFGKKSTGKTVIYGLAISSNKDHIQQENLKWGILNDYGFIICQLQEQFGTNKIIIRENREIQLTIATLKEILRRARDESGTSHYRYQRRICN
jgi:hypothetical protein